MVVEGTCLCGGARWRFDAPIESTTACNCTACRRYGALWAYDYEGEGIIVSGPTKAYTRGGANLGFHFCEKCGCVTWWRAMSSGADGRRRIAVNLRLAENPDEIAGLLIDHFDGLGAFEDLPGDGKCVKDMWL